MSEAEELLLKLETDARAGGYLLNPDRGDALMLAEGLLTNIKRFGYPSCPCRVAEGSREADRDIICPCDYRDPDLSDHGACYCALYVTQEWIQGKVERKVVPERRPPEAVREREGFEPRGLELVSRGRHTVWRCKVCGYLCAREKPPPVCPICKATADRFEPFG